MTLLAVYFQLASSNYSYIVELYNFQLNAVNKTIHTLDKFSYIATFYKLECLSQCLEHFSTYQVIFQTQPCIFSTKLLNFCLHYSDHWSRPGRPPQRSLCRSGWFFSPLCFKRKCLPAPSHMCSVHFKWSVICNEILDCLIFDGLIWSKSLITWSQSGHKIQSKHC